MVPMNVALTVAHCTEFEQHAEIGYVKGDYHKMDNYDFIMHFVVRLTL